MIFFIGFDILVLCLLICRVNETIHLSIELKRLPPGHEKKVTSANFTVHLIVSLVLFFVFTGLTFLLVQFW